MKDFRQLKIWQKSHQLALLTYKTTSNFPREEQFGLTSQIRRAAVSIPSNIAEGCGRKGDIEFSRFLQISMGSASELEYQLQLANELGYLSQPSYREVQGLVEELKKMLATLIKKLQENPSHD